MNNRFYESLAASDAELGQKIRTEHHHWFAAIETALDQVIQGLNEYAEINEKPKGKLESARLFLATRTFINLRLALQLLEKGYCQPAAILIRTAMEEMLIADDIEVYPKTLDVLLDESPTAKIRLGRDDLSYGAMAGRISTKAAEVWKDTYESVSVYATHPRSTGLKALVSWDSKDVPHLSLASSYNREQLAVCIELVATECLSLSKTVMQLLDETGSDWKVRAYPSYGALEELIGEARRTADSQ